MTQVTIERIDEKGGKHWTRTRLSLDLVAGVIEIQQRGRLGRKKPPLIFRAGEITGFDIVTVSDPLEHIYGVVLLVALLAVLNASGWIVDGTGWEFVRILLDLAAFGLAFLLASWIKVPAVRLEQRVSQSSPPPQADNLDLASLKGRNSDDIVKDPVFRRTLAERLVKQVALQPGKALRDILSTAGKDPATALEQLEEMEHSPTLNWVHIVSTWNGVTGTLSVAAQIADVLASHRYRGMFPELVDDSRWRTARLHRLLGAGLVMAVSLSAAAMVVLHFVK